VKIVDLSMGRSSTNSMFFSPTDGQFEHWPIIYSAREAARVTTEPNGRVARKVRSIFIGLNPLGRPWSAPTFSAAAVPDAGGLNGGASVLPA
jgi:hypothetical protein